MAYGEQLPEDSGGKKFEGVVANNAGANAIPAKAGSNYRLLNGEPVADQVVDLTTSSGAGASIGTPTDPAASSTVPEDTTSRTAIGLLKGIKNILILLKTALNGGLPAALGAGGGLKVDGSGTALPVAEAQLPAALGPTTKAASLSVTLSTNEPLVSLLPASLGQKAANDSLAVIPALRELTNPITRIAGDNLSHSLGFTATGATLYPSDDTMLSENQSTYNGGGYNELDVGAVGASNKIRRAILRFALEGYALNTIATAMLRLKTIAVAPPAGGILQAHAIKPANSGWVEGAQNWGAASGTDPSWAKKSQTPDIAWAGSAGLSTSGTDYDALSLGSLTWTADASTWFEMTMVAAYLQALAAANNGLLLVADDETTTDKYARFHSSEAADKPELVITVAAAQKTPKFVYLVADSVGATWKNGSSATATDAPIPVGGIEVPYRTNDVVGLSVYVPIGCSAWFAGVGYE